MLSGREDTCQRRVGLVQEGFKNIGFIVWVINKIVRVEWLLKRLMLENSIRNQRIRPQWILDITYLQRSAGLAMWQGKRGGN